MQESMRAHPHLMEEARGKFQRIGSKEKEACKTRDRDYSGDQVAQEPFGKRNGGNDGYLGGLPKPV